MHVLTIKMLSDLISCVLVKKMLSNLKSVLVVVEC